MKALCSFAILAVLVSCGPAQELKRRDLSQIETQKVTDGKINLDTKNVGEVLKIKYDNKVFLRCTLNVKKGNQIQEQILSENLAETPNLLKTMSSSVNGIKIEAEIQSTRFTIFGKINHEDPLKTKYFMTHTPVAEISVKWTNTDEAGVVSTGNTDMVLYENVPDLFVVQMTDKGIVKNFRCGLSATSVKEYQDEWTISESAPIIPMPIVAAPENNPAETSVNPEIAPES